MIEYMSFEWHDIEDREDLVARVMTLAAEFGWDTEHVLFEYNATPMSAGMSSDVHYWNVEGKAWVRQ